MTRDPLDLSVRTRYFPVEQPNRIKTVTRLETGDLRVEQYSGATFTVSADNPDFQTFLIWTILTPTPNKDAQP